MVCHLVLLSDYVLLNVLEWGLQLLGRPCALEFSKAIMRTRTQDKMYDCMHLSVPKWLCALIFFPLVGIFWHVIDIFVFVEFGKSKFKLGVIQKLF